METESIRERICKLLEVKSLVTIILTMAMVGMLFSQRSLPQEMVALFSGIYGAVITYFFTRKSSEQLAAETE